MLFLVCTLIVVFIAAKLYTVFTMEPVAGVGTDNGVDTADGAIVDDQSEDKVVAMTTVQKTYSIAARRELLNSSKGRVFTVEWITKDGRQRKATCKRWQAKSITYYPEVMANPCGHIEHLYTCVDINKEKTDPVKSWVNIDLRTIQSIRINSVTYTF